MTGVFRSEKHIPGCFI